jgi:hypothetical protein
MSKETRTWIEWRRYRLLTREGLASLAHASLGTVRRAETGHPISLLSAQRLAAALEIDLGQINELKLTGRRPP